MRPVSRCPPRRGFAGAALSALVSFDSTQIESNKLELSLSLIKNKVCSNHINYECLSISDVIARRQLWFDSISQAVKGPSQRGPGSRGIQTYPAWT